MSLTAGSKPLTPPLDRLAERIEIMAALWQVADGSNAYCANPRLLTVLRLVPALQSHPAATLLANLRQDLERDQVIKALTQATYGLTVEPRITALVGALGALSASWDDELGALAVPLAKAHRQMQQQAAEVTAPLSPAEDLSAITGDPDRLHSVVLPSLFLPPPQTGRHGAMVVPGDGVPVAHLFFGYPLDLDPLTFGISRYWVEGGGWHYAVDRFIRRHWGPIAAELRAMPDLEKALVAALTPHRESVVWPLVLAEHINIALKCQLSRRADLPQVVHRGFARARGLAFFPWFDQWIEQLAANPATFVAEFCALPQAVAEARQALIAIAADATSGPPTINLALAQGEKTSVVVVPDHWPDEIAKTVGDRWSMVAPTLMRQSQWRVSDLRDKAPMIALGEGGADALVDGLLTRRKVHFDSTEHGGDIVIALVPPPKAGRPWQIAVAVDSPQTAAAFGLEQAMDLFHGVARFANNRFVSGDSAAQKASHPHRHPQAEAEAVS